MIIAEHFIDGVPVPQPRQRHSGYFDKKTKRIMVRNYTPEKHPVNAWKRIVLTEVRLLFRRLNLEQFTGPVAVDLVFVFPRPKSKKRKTKPNYRDWHCQKPDKDNLEKAIFDSLSEYAWNDDCQIVAGETMKFTAGDGDRHGVAIRFRNVDQVECWADGLIRVSEDQGVLYA